METNQSFPQIFWGMVGIGGALIVSSAIGGAAISQLRGQDVLTVIGSAKRPIESDYVVWKSAVSSQQPTLQESYRQLKGYTDRVVDYLKSQGVTDESLTLSAITTESIPELVNGSSTGRVIAYRLSQSFVVSSKDVDRVAKISQGSTELINEGIPYTSDSPEYLYTQLSKLRVEMIAEATKDAKARADAIAGVTNTRVGVVRNAETDVFQITRRFSTEVSNSGSYDTTSIDKDITAVVSITFTVK